MNFVIKNILDNESKIFNYDDIHIFDGGIPAPTTKENNREVNNTEDYLPTKSD